MGDVIKEFLVGLGFDVDDSSLQKFNKAIATATARVTALYASIKVLSAAVFWSVSKISEGFEQMGYEYRIIAPAINRTLYLRQELLKAYRAAGINIQQVVKNAVLFNLSVIKTKYAFEAIYKSVASRFFPLLTKQLDVFRKNLYANMPRIQNGLERFIKFIFKAFEATTILGARIWSILTRVYDFFAKLHKATDGWSSIIFGVIAAWKLLNLSFLATPLGMLLVGFAALLALWDDFKTFQEGGESLIDWGSRATKVIVGVGAAVAGLAAIIWTVNVATKAWTAAQWLLDAALAANPIGLIIIAVTALIAALGVLAYKMGWLNGIADKFAGVGEKVMNFFGNGENAMANMQAANSPMMGSAPLGAQGNNTSIAQSVNQATNINITGSADAGAIGKSVAGEQNRVNFDMVRNMKSATR